MIIKRYQAKTEEEATNLAKKELGDEVFIMNVKTKKAKGLFAFLKSPVVEVTAAKEEDDDIASSNNAKNIKDAISSIDRLRSESELKDGTNDKSKLSLQNNSKVDDSQKNKKEIDVNDSEKENVKSQRLEKKVDSIQTLLESKILKGEETNNQAPLNNNRVSDELKETPDSETISFMKLLYNTMVDNEVSQQYANQMVEEIQQNYSKNMQMEDILSHIYQKMILKFGKAVTISPSEKKGPKVVFFIGPTGVGKTTTLAKIASNLCIIENKKVALFTADTYRISAKDQLKTYATILDTPFEVIYENESDLENCENKFSGNMEETYKKYIDYDYILVDTAGHSHYNEDQREKMNSFIHSLDDKADTEVYLVLSATTKYKDLILIADTYSQMTSYKLIFTKLDETSSYGNLLNLRIHTKAPMSYITCGQNVPADIDKFDPQNIVRKLLGGNA